jgi:hypothetical protein
LVSQVKFEVDDRRDRQPGEFSVGHWVRSACLALAIEERRISAQKSSSSHGIGSLPDVHNWQEPRPGWDTGLMRDGTAGGWDVGQPGQQLVQEGLPVIDCGVFIVAESDAALSLQIL